jgi:hypothetical protein
VAVNCWRDVFTVAAAEIRGLTKIKNQKLEIKN